MASRETCGLCTSMPGPEELLQGQGAARFDREHPVEAQARRRDPFRCSPLGVRKVRASCVPLRRCTAARELAVVMEPGSEDLDVRVVHHALRPDELLERSGDLLVEHLRRPVLDAAANGIVEAGLPHGPLLLGQTTALVLAPASAGARSIPRDIPAAHASGR
jgi:hypothetical protein